MADLLPVITVEGEPFFDMSSIVTPNRFIRPRTDGLAIHHSVSTEDFPDRNFNGTNMDEEIAHIKAINKYHIDQDYGGFGYNGISFASGRVYVVGDGTGARAHVANHNNHLEGLCLAGSFTDHAPPLGEVLGAARWVKAKRAQHGGGIAIRGHRLWADPDWATACPGDQGLHAIETILNAASALERGQRESQDRMIKDRLRLALQENWDKLDLAALHGQIHWLLGVK